MIKFFGRFVPILVVVGLVWAVESVNYSTGHALNQLGIRPRVVEGLAGIPFAPFLHVGLTHAISNTVPLLVLGGLILATVAGTRFWTVTVMVIAIGGGLTWALARDVNTVHVGASGLIFGYFGYLVARGPIERSLSAIAVALLVVLVYGGFIYGLFPRGPTVSFESHIFGFFAGALAAWALGGRAGRWRGAARRR